MGDFGAGLGHYGRCFLRHDGDFIVRGNEIERNALTRFFWQEMTKAKLAQTPQVIQSWHGAYFEALALSWFAEMRSFTNDLTRCAFILNHLTIKMIHAALLLLSLYYCNKREVIRYLTRAHVLTEPFHQTRTSN